jgi:hypothetical protein
MPAIDAHKRLFSAILRIRAQLRLVDQVAAELERDRRPKLSPRIPSRKPQIAISGPYFIRAAAEPVTKAGRGLRMFPRSHPPSRWKQAWEQRKCLI